MIVVAVLSEYKIEVDNKLFRIVIAISGTILYLALNASINAFNYTYKKQKSRFKAFYMPIIIWSMFLLYSVLTLIVNGVHVITEWIFAFLLQ